MSTRNSKTTHDDHTTPHTTPLDHKDHRTTSTTLWTNVPQRLWILRIVLHFMNSYLGVSVFFLCIFSNYNKVTFVSKIIGQSNHNGKSSYDQFLSYIRKRDWWNVVRYGKHKLYLRTFAHPLAILDFGLKPWTINETA